MIQDEMFDQCLFLKKRRVRCEIFGFFVLSFPQNERKIYQFCSVSFSQLVYFLREVQLLFNFLIIKFTIISFFAKFVVERSS
jgi:hypothetical protein